MDWNLVISGLALMVSIGIALREWRHNQVSNAATRRLALVQKILATKGAIYEALHDLQLLLVKSNHAMPAEERQRLTPLVPKLREQHAAFERMYDEWSDQSTRSSASEVEQTLLYVEGAYAEAQDMQKLIAHGMRTHDAAPQAPQHAERRSNRRRP